MEMQAHEREAQPGTLWGGGADRHHLSGNQFGAVCYRLLTASDISGKLTLCMHEDVHDSIVYSGEKLGMRRRSIVGKVARKVTEHCHRTVR